MATLKKKDYKSNGVLDAISAAEALSGMLFDEDGTTVTQTSGGSTTTQQSAKTSTKQTQVSQAYADEIVRGILEGNQGLAAISSGANASGAYNSTTQQLLANDLIARTAGKVAVDAAPTVVTEAPNQSTVVQSPTSSTVQKTTAAPVSALGGIGGLATLAGGAYVGNKVLKNSGVLEAIDGGLDSIIGSVFGPGGGASGAGSAVAGAGGLAGGAQVLDVIGASGASGALSAAPLTLDLAGGAGSLAGGAAGLLDVAGASGSLATGGASLAEASTGLFGPVGAESISSSFMGTELFSGGPTIGAVVPYIPAVGHLLSGNETAAATSAVGAAIGNAILPGIGGWVGGTIGSAVGGGCYITTATVGYMGLEDDCYELQTLRRFRDGWLKSNHPADIQHYYDTAPKVLAAIEQEGVPFDTRRQFFNAVFNNYVQPAVQAIESGNNQRAYAIYKEMTDSVAAYAGEQ